MSPVTHALISWATADRAGLPARDRVLAAWSGILPDLDGLGIIPDLIAQSLGGGSALYITYHRLFLHGLPGALIVSAILSFFALNKRKTFFFCLLIFHLHLLCDLAGSRGPTIYDIWPIHYLSPLSDMLTFSWSGQWPINGWPNILLSLLLLAFAFRQAIVAGSSPVELFSAKANDLVVAALRRRWSSLKRQD